MVILGIETSCDETAAAIVKGPSEDGRVKILSNIISSTPELLAKFGGIMPEQTARAQLESIIPVLQKTIDDSQLAINDLDAIAVTYGPGLIGSLLVGVETAKTLALAWGKPLIPVNHLLGHFYANWVTHSVTSTSDLIGEKQSKLLRHAEFISASQTLKQVQGDEEEIALSGSTSLTIPRNDVPSFPCLGLLVSGGHTDLVLFTDHGKYKYLGGTRDDAAGECFDKCARVLGLPYPGGAALAELAIQGNPKAYKLPRPMINSSDFDLSFSGLKTAVINQLSKFQKPITDNRLIDLCASIEAAIAEVLVKKTIRAARQYQVDQIMIAGGVAANQTLTQQFLNLFHGPAYIPPAYLCTDNAVMIAACAIFNFCPVDPLKIESKPDLSLY